MTTLPFPAQPDAPPAEHPEYRRSDIETGVGGSIRFVYRDENGYVLLDWACDVRVGEEARRMIGRAQELAGEKLPALSARSTPLLGPRLVP